MRAIVAEYLSLLDFQRETAFAALDRKFSMMRVPFLLAILLLALVACVPQTADGGPQTAVPLNTEHRPLNTATPTVAPTATPLPHPIAFDPAFTSGLIRHEGGEWLVAAAYRTADGELQTADFVLIPTSFATHDDLREHNPLAPYTVRALDQNGQELTLLWNPDTAEFRVVPNFQELYTGVNTDNPQLNEEALASLPTLTIEDVQSGDATRFILSHILERMDKGESLADILHMDPDAVRQNWQNLGGNSLLFEILPDGTRIASLKAKGNDGGNQQQLDGLTMRYMDIGGEIIINGQRYPFFYVANFDPQNQENPDPEDLSNWKFFVCIATVEGQPQSFQEPLFPNADWSLAFRRTNPIFPSLVLFATNPDLDPNDPENIVIQNPDDPNSPPVILPRNSIYAQLLSIPGNDASRMEYQDGYLDMQVNITNGMNHLPELRIIETQSLSRPLPPELQLITPVSMGNEWPANP